MKIVGVICFVTCILFVAVNSIFMVISPAIWFRLPSWLRATGSLREKKYARGFGALQVRLVGLIFLLVMGWAVYDGLFKR